VLLEKTGLDTLVIHEFTKDFAEKTALDFVKNVLVDNLKISKLIIGYDHRFGKNREGHFDQLTEYGKIFGFEVTKISQQEIDHITISSTKIRKAIELGNIEEANRYLGYAFMLTGEIVKGKNLGEKIGFPTANLFIEETYKLLPKTGSYIVKSELENETVYGMMNIGYNPTVKGKNQTIEIHFFDFNKNLYGKKIQIDVLEFLRDEQKFDSVEDLKNQLEKDKQKSLKIIQDNLFNL
ncbi:MAG: riboflavin biosynthesis protein RibF, partial [Lutibacter sp.]|nr:riboflavin biosynthesis protein RibF [Lutibacter sp.]